MQGDNSLPPHEQDTAKIENDTLENEIVSINSIFDEGTLSPINEGNIQLCSLRLPPLPSVTLRVEFSQDYPDAPPSILGTQSVGSGMQKGAGARVVDFARERLAKVFVPGDVCIYDLLEDVREALDDEDLGERLSLFEDENKDQEEPQPPPPDPVPDLGPEPPWIITPGTNVKKSLFRARAAPVSSPEQAKQYVAHLLATDKSVERATHNMTAWRIRGPNGTTYQDCDDDGETAAGGRMLHLMQLMDVWDVMVVVTRWFGGVLLGPERFRVINTEAREALVLGGFTREKEGEGNEEKDGDGKKKGKKKK